MKDNKYNQKNDEYNQDNDSSVEVFGLLLILFILFLLIKTILQFF